MQQAFEEALKAKQIGEVPVGAVVVAQGRVIGRGHNLVEQLSDPTAHAEMIAITSACNYMGSKYLTSATLYVTLEPCPMCAGAIFWAQCKRLVFAALDHSHGFYSGENRRTLHPKTAITTGILQHESELLLRQFFQSIRK